jgi:hypothetical protein
VTTTAAKDETTSAPPAILLETRVRGFAPKNTNAIGLELSVSSTLRWGSWHIYDGTAVDRLVGLDFFGARYFSGAREVHQPRLAFVLEALISTDLEPLCVCSE